MSILLDEMVEYKEVIEAKYWGLIFDICNAIRADHEYYYNLTKDIRTCKVSKVIGAKSVSIDVCKLSCSLLFSIEINHMKVLWFELERDVITEFVVDAPVGKSHIDILEYVYTLL